jgi:hypothetical protein
MFALLLTAELEGYVLSNPTAEEVGSRRVLNNPSHRVTNLRPDDSEANPFWYMFKVQCTSCRETHANYVGVNRFVWDNLSSPRTS